MVNIVTYVHDNAAKFKEFLMVGAFRERAYKNWHVNKLPNRVRIESVLRRVLHDETAELNEVLDELKDFR